MTLYKNTYLNLLTNRLVFMAGPEGGGGAAETPLVEGENELINTIKEGMDKNATPQEKKEARILAESLLGGRYSKKSEVAALLTPQEKRRMLKSASVSKKAKAGLINSTPEKEWQEIRASLSNREIARLNDDLSGKKRKRKAVEKSAVAKNETQEEARQLSRRYGEELVDLEAYIKKARKHKVKLADRKAGGPKIKKDPRDNRGLTREDWEEGKYGMRLKEDDES